jgi:hypothetical protein
MDSGPAPPRRSALAQRAQSRTRWDRCLTIENGELSKAGDDTVAAIPWRQLSSCVEMSIIVTMSHAHNNPFAN